MDHFEMVEKLRSKTNVSYEEAKAALEASDWDLLDALLYLENKGRVRTENETNYTTRQEPRIKQEPESDKEEFKGFLERVFIAIGDLVKKGNRTFLDIHRRDHKLLELPLTAVLLLFLISFPITMWVFVISLFFGFRYSFRGENVSDSVNRALDKAADQAENVFSGFHNKNNPDSQDNGKNA